MPIYTYFCSSCQKNFIKISKVGENSTTNCPECDAECSKIPSVPNFRMLNDREWGKKLYGYSDDDIDDMKHEDCAI